MIMVNERVVDAGILITIGVVSAIISVALGVNYAFNGGIAYGGVMLIIFELGRRTIRKTEKVNDE
jgi:hypothetical protein